MKCDQDLCLNSWYDPKSYLQDELNPRVRCAFGNVYIFIFYNIDIGFVSSLILFLF